MTTMMCNGGRAEDTTSLLRALVVAGVRATIAPTRPIVAAALAPTARIFEASAGFVFFRAASGCRCSVIGSDPGRLVLLLMTRSRR